MGMTRETGVRCPWCARPVADGPDRPELCPSCGVPLAPPAPPAAHSVTFAVPAARARRSQRLRATAALLGLTSVILSLAAVPLALTALSSDHGDSQAQRNLVAVLRSAEDVKLRTVDFLGAQPVALNGKVFGVKVVDNLEPSTGPNQVSMVVSGDGWYGAVHSAGGRCFAAATLDGDPRMIQAVLPANCTGDAARAAMMPPPSGSRATMSPAPGTSTAAP